jgi:hypothetical protein
MTCIESSAIIHHHAQFEQLGNFPLVLHVFQSMLSVATQRPWIHFRDAAQGQRQLGSPLHTAIRPEPARNVLHNHICQKEHFFDIYIFRPHPVDTAAIHLVQGDSASDAA